MTRYPPSGRGQHGPSTRGNVKKGYWRRPWPVALSLVGAFGVVYALALHPWIMSWGATSNEVGKTLPGDERATAPYFTRAISIDSAPAAVWPWLVQIGQDRAGFYSNDWLENVFTSDIHSADAIHPEWQERAVGDRVPLARAGLADLGGARGTIGHVEIVSGTERMIANLPGRFVLENVGARGTRLLFRESVASQGPVLARWLGSRALRSWFSACFAASRSERRGSRSSPKG